MEAFLRADQKRHIVRQLQLPEVPETFLEELFPQTLSTEEAFAYAKMIAFAIDFVGKIAILQDMVDTGKLDAGIVDGFIHHYDAMLEQVERDTRMIHRTMQMDYQRYYSRMQALTVS